MTANANITIITKEEQEFIIKNIDNGLKLLAKEDWQEIIRELDHLELMTGYIDNDFDKGINDTGRYIEILIDKIAIAEAISLENDIKFKIGPFTTTVRFYKLLLYVSEHWNQGKIYVLHYGTEEVVAKCDTIYETCDVDPETGEDCDEDYREIVFCDVKFNSLFGINYMNLPDEIYCDGERIV